MTFCILRPQHQRRGDEAWCGKSTKGAHFRFTGLDSLMDHAWAGGKCKPCPDCLVKALAGFANAVEELVKMDSLHPV